MTLVLFHGFLVLAWQLSGFLAPSKARRCDAVNVWNNETRGRFERLNDEMIPGDGYQLVPTLLCEKPEVCAQ